MDNERWDRRFLELARHISTWSKDPSTKTGSVVVDNERTIMSMGYNGFPRGFVDSPQKYEDRMFKYKHIIHSERNAMDLASASLKNCTLYCTHPPCLECQKSIVQKGIKRVVWYTPSYDFKMRWSEGFRILIEANIEYTIYDPPS